MLKELWGKLFSTDEPKPARKPRQRKPRPAPGGLAEDLSPSISPTLRNHHERITELERGLEALREQVRDHIGPI